MAFAISLKTESGDDYVFAFDGEPTTEEIVESVKEKMGDEFNYVYNWNHDATYDIDFKMVVPEIDEDYEDEIDEDSKWDDFDDEE